MGGSFGKGGDHRRNYGREAVWTRGATLGATKKSRYRGERGGLSG